MYHQNYGQMGYPQPQPYQYEQYQEFRNVPRNQPQENMRRIPVGRPINESFEQEYPQL